VITVPCVCDVDLLIGIIRFRENLPVNTDYLAHGPPRTDIHLRATRGMRMMTSLRYPHKHNDDDLHMEIVETQAENWSGVGWTQTPPRNVPCRFTIFCAVNVPSSLQPLEADEDHVLDGWIESGPT